MKFHHTIALGLTLALFAGCTKYETLTITQKEKKGSVYGFVTLVGESLQPVKDKSGIKVSLEGMVPEIFAYTDTGGSYRLDSIETGSYHLVFEKAGFRTEIHALAFNAPGGNQPTYYQDITPVYYYISGTSGKTVLVEACKTTPSLPVVSNTGRITIGYDTLITFSGTLTPNEPSAYRSVVLYYDTIPGVSYSRNMGNFLQSNARNGMYAIRLFTGDEHLFQNGRQYYGSLYGKNRTELSWYNIITGRFESVPPTNPTEEFTFTPRW